jgi:polyhydroxyalkanoate synthase
MARSIARAEPGSFDRALNRQIVTACDRFARGIEAYRRHPYRRAPEAAVEIWRRGAAALLDHGVLDRGSGAPVLFVPSLINRGWVLDLVPGEGMLSWLAMQGINPYRIEWGSPGPEELAFSIADYVRLRLLPAIDAAGRHAGRPVILAGYCMGGLLTLAACVSRPSNIAGLALLGSPWDFHATDAARGRSLAALYDLTRPLLEILGSLPIDFIQAFFALHDPAVALRKFQRFAALDPDSIEARNFVALEDWLNDGVPLPLPVAREAIVDWSRDNATAQRVWRVGDVAVDPAALNIPVLVAVPRADRIVPPASAAAILPLLARGERLDPALGHIGMVVGRGAAKGLWRPLAEWILRTARDGAPS